ncbi:MAG TPA: FAD-binding oxidoreductase [Streptosporangiaceae bacterium]|jgi:FAD/FMN-containing dehydrogenase
MADTSIERPVTGVSVEPLRERVRGQVLTAGDEGYDQARAVHNGMFDKRPLAVLRAEQVADVIAGVNFARDNGLDLSIRDGGHSAPGFGTNDGGLVIDMSPMHTVRVDPQAKTARADAGATWGDFNHATHAFGLATTGGIISTTGITGLTLGGGIGYLTRGCGLSLDNLASADVVTADGKFVTASAHENEDLFWGLRGGGGNFGVVTSLKYRLHEVDKVFAGPIFYNLEDAAALLGMFDEFIQDAPEQFGGFPGFQIAPPLPFIPENRHGDTLALAVVHWAGPLDQAEKVLKPFFDVAPVVANGTGPLPYPALNAAFDVLYPKGIRAYWKGAFVNELPEQAIAVHVEHGSQVPEMSATMHLYPINGACHRVGPSDTAFAYRDAKYAMVFLASWADSAKDAERIRWVRDYHQALTPYSEPGGYINFMQDDDYGKIHANYRQNYDRLVQIKRAYDPGNLFHINQNIAP